jgi:hypothetical protein
MRAAGSSVPRSCAAWATLLAGARAVFDDDAIGVAGIRGVGGERRKHHQCGG